MKELHQVILKNKYKTILYSQAILLICLIIILGLSKNKSSNNEILQTAGLLTAIGYLSIIIYPILWVQKKVLMLIHVDFQRIPSSGSIFNFIFISLIYLSMLGGVLFVTSSFLNIEIVPVYFAIPGVSFVFALIGDRK